MQNNTLPNDVEQLKLLVQSWQEKYFNLLEQFKLAKLRQYASSSEKNVLQGDLLVLSQKVAISARVDII